MRWSPAITALCTLLLAGCAPTPDATATDPDNGGRVELSKGDLFDIVLADDYKTTNCQWRDEQPADWRVLKPLGSRYEPDRVPPTGHGDSTWTGRYRAVGPGTAHVVLVEEDNANPPRIVRRFTLDVTVR